MFEVHGQMVTAHPPASVPSDSKYVQFSDVVAPHRIVTLINRET